MSIGRKDFGPIPGAAYPDGTMSVADIYPTHVGIGGITTQDRALPAFQEATSAAAQRLSSMDPIGLAGSPAGWFALLLVGLAVAAWRYR